MTSKTNQTDCMPRNYLQPWMLHVEEERALFPSESNSNRDDHTADTDSDASYTDGNAEQRQTQAQRPTRVTRSG